MQRNQHKHKQTVQLPKRKHHLVTLILEHIANLGVVKAVDSDSLLCLPAVSTCAAMPQKIDMHYAHRQKHPRHLLENFDFDIGILL